MAQATGPAHNMQPAPGGDGMLVARFPPPLGRGLDSILTTNPPRRANLPGPSGTIGIISSNKSRDAISSRRFEVGDFAKQILAAAQEEAWRFR